MKSWHHTVSYLRPPSYVANQKAFKLNAYYCSGSFCITV